MIREILNSHDINGWDKDGGTDKGTIHSYIDAYEKYLSPFIDKECSLLEIGVWHGGSSLLWHDFLPKAKICGIDINYLVHEKVQNKLTDRYRFYEMNAYTEATVGTIENNYPDGFDIIIEDGIHTEESNKFSIEHYLPMLRSGGIMIIEDVPANTPIEIPFEYSPIQGVIERMIELVPKEYVVTVIDLTQINGRYDDILFVIKKPS